jgi:adenine-specific DNA-methyltransferase
MSQKYEKLKTLLKELFQLDQPDLDFGLYRIMHAKSAEVSQFLDKDLLPQVKAAFGAYKTADKAEIEKELTKAVEQAQGLGVDPDTTQKVKDLRAKLASEAVDLGQLESEVYDHLFSFFRRYYSEGDFLAKRVYKPGVYAIPYEGEEVTLHWANKDQYYIKTSEYLRDYAFRLRPDDDQKPMRVHFRLVDAAEGEHGNVKAAEGKDRVFILSTGGETGRDFIAEADGEQGKELSIRLEYRPATLTDWPEDVREGKSKPPAQKDLSAAAVKRILAVADASLAPWVTELGKPHVLASGERADYTRLEAHLCRFTARNTFDYFIHKDLGAFLRRELDFYIKNEVMHLDDVQNETAPRVEQYLSKIRVIRRIAGKIIDFLAQLEDFQKKLWLKKKFVVETSYCIRLGIIPEMFYPEIAANEAQREEWVRLCAIDEIRGDLTIAGYSVPLATDFLTAQTTLFLDTRFFDAAFTARLLEAVGNLADGVLIHAENAHGLRLAKNLHREAVDCVYIDPPYNTGEDGFPYKDHYVHSSWVAMMAERLALLRSLLKHTAAVYSSINENELPRLLLLLDDVMGADRYIGNFAVKVRHEDRILKGDKDVHEVIEYLLGYRRSWDHAAGKRLQDNTSLEEYVWSVAITGEPIEMLSLGGRDVEVYDPASYRVERGESSATALKRINIRGTLREGNSSGRYYVAHLEPRLGSHDGHLFKVREMGSDGLGFRYFLLPTGASARRNGDYFQGVPIGRPDVRAVPYPNLLDYEKDFNQCADEGGVTFRNGKKAVRFIEHVMTLAGTAQTLDALVVDYFAGSGTTGHAVINLNRRDGGKRRFVLVEQAGYFDEVLLPRMKKVTFSPEWKDGKPKRLATPEEAERSPRIMKVVRLESYEDALNNLETRRTEAQRTLLDAAEAQGADGLKEQYLLRYMLDVETRGSQSLLNVQAFSDPTAYKLKVKRPGSDESREVNVDLLETFNWLIGLTVRHIAAPQTFSAAFERDSEQRLRLKGRLKQAADGPFWFRTVTGATPDGRKTLVIWRKLTGNPEEDNLVLDEWFTKQGYSSKDREFDLIYVNGGNNLENLKAPDDTWKVRLLEEDFHRLMFDTEGA